MKLVIDKPEALAAADAALASKGRSFHWARRLLGQNHADRATRLYGFCRHLDDLADESTSAANAREKLAGTVGIMMCGVLDVRSPVAHAYAVDLGIAMQLTNISRDVAEDAAAGRIYLPASMIGELTPAELIFPSEMLRPRLRECVAA